jgi:hypothetical protein
MGRCSYKISRVWAPQLIVGIIGFELRTMNTSMFFLSTAAAIFVAHHEEDGRGGVVEGTKDPFIPRADHYLAKAA